MILDRTWGGLSTDSDGLFVRGSAAMGLGFIGNFREWWFQYKWINDFFDRMMRMMRIMIIIERVIKTDIIIIGVIILK